MRATLLLPVARRFSGTLGTLARWIARGDRLPTQPAGRDAALRGCFEFIGTTIPAAALTREVDARDAAGAQWLRCDPACIVADAVTLRLVACGSMGLSLDDVAALTRALKPIFGDAGFPLEASHAERWYLRCPREAKLPTFSTPDDALGDDLVRHLPDGDGAARFRALLNEAQVVLTQHPLNEQRARKGQAAVNSVWFWGPGALPDWVRSGYSRIYSDDEVVVALATRAKIPASALARGGEDARSDQHAITPFDAAQEADANVLVDLARLRDAAELERSWFATAAAALKSGRLRELLLRFESGEQVCVKPAQRWRFWRRTPPLA